MDNKYKTHDIVRDNCGCKITILKVGYKYYTCINLEDMGVHHKTLTYQVGIKELDERSKLIKV